MSKKGRMKLNTAALTRRAGLKCAQKAVGGGFKKVPYDKSHAAEKPGFGSGRNVKGGFGK